MGPFPQDFLTQVAVILGLIVLCVLGYRTIAWFRQDAHGVIHREEDALQPFLEAFEAGEIDREEFDRVRAALERQRTPSPTSPPPAPPSAPSQDVESTSAETPSAEPS